MGGKHTSEAVTIRQLEETITLKDKEINESEVEENKDSEGER